MQWMGRVMAVGLSTALLAVQVPVAAGAEEVAKVGTVQELAKRVASDIKDKGIQPDDVRRLAQILRVLGQYAEAQGLDERLKTLDRSQYPDARLIRALRQQGVRKTFEAIARYDERVANQAGHGVVRTIAYVQDPVCDVWDISVWCSNNGGGGGDLHATICAALQATIDALHAVMLAACTDLVGGEEFCAAASIAEFAAWLAFWAAGC